MIRIIALFSLLFSAVSLQAESAQCTRAGLQAATDKYLEALKQGTPSLMPLAPQAKYIENRKEMPFGQGIWQTALAYDFHRSFFDVETCGTYSEIIQATGSHPYVLGTRLKIAGDKISEVESLVTDKDDWLFNAANYLKFSPPEKWDILPVAQRSDRQTLINAANAYFDVFSNPAASSNVPWGIPCERLEGGIYTNPKGDPKASCTGGAPLEGSVKLINRRFLADLDMGTVIGLADFGEQNSLPDSHIFRLENGKIRFVHTLTVCTTPYCGFPKPQEEIKNQ
jgi:hypothetical protein